MHINSIEAFKDLELGGNQEEIYEIYKSFGPQPLTDRRVLRILQHGRQGDMNRVRPRINELLRMPNTPIKEVGSIKCPTTGRRVRAVAYVPTDSKQDKFEVQ